MSRSASTVSTIHPRIVGRWATEWAAHISVTVTRIRRMVGRDSWL
jgi:hypothetical protein